VDAAEVSGGAVLTNMYGLEIGDQTAATNNYAIKTGKGKVEFGDDLSVIGKLYLTPQTPASSSATCTANQVAMDANYVYVCTAADTWKRAALSTW
jgi:hypothetical protein